jgi:hypothetical protein
MQLFTNKLFYAALLCAALLLLPLVTLTAQQPDSATVLVRLLERTTGAPLAAEVGLALQTANGVLLKHATANAQGEVEFTSLPGGVVHLSTKHDMYAVERAGFELAPAATQHLELHLVKAVPVRGVVLDPSGTPLAGAQVKAVYERANEPFANSYQWETGDARSDEQGGFALEVHPEREFVIEAARAGFLSDFTTPLRASAAPTVTLQLTRGTRVTGTVRDTAGNPLAGVQVQLSDAGERATLQRFLPFEALQQSRQFTVTADDGTFQFNHVRPIRKALLITHLKYAPERQTLDLTLRQPQFETRVTLRNQNER